MKKRVRWLLIGLAVLALGVAICWRHERDVNQDLESQAGAFTIVLAGGSNTTMNCDKPLIIIAPEVAQLSAHPSGGWGRSGRTGMQISVMYPDQSMDDVLRPFVEGLNESPTRAREILQHYDLRMRLIGLAIIGEIVRQNSGTDQPMAFGSTGPMKPLGPMKPHVVDALVDLVKNTDPLIASHALRLLESANCFRADVVAQGLQHPSESVRMETMLYCERCQPGKAQTSPAELRAALTQLIAHLDDPHLAIRGMAFNTIRKLMIVLEAKLQGVPIQDAGEWTHGVKIIKLPLPPEGYRDLVTMSAKDVQAVKAEWEAWLSTVPQYEQEQTTPPAGETAK